MPYIKVYDRDEDYVVGDVVEFEGLGVLVLNFPTEEGYRCDGCQLYHSARCNGDGDYYEGHCGELLYWEKPKRFDVNRTIFYPPRTAGYIGNELYQITRALDGCKSCDYVDEFKRCGEMCPIQNRNHVFKRVEYKKSIKKYILLCGKNRGIQKEEL